jgi:hypothetical protein
MNCVIGGGVMRSRGAPTSHEIPLKRSRLALLATALAVAVVAGLIANDENRSSSPDAANTP